MSKFNGAESNTAGFANAVQSGKDSWLGAMEEWTREMLGSQWTICSGAWPDNYAKPAVLWQITGVNVSQVGPSSYETEKTLTATVVMDDSDAELTVVVQLLEELGSVGKILLPGSERRFLRVSGLKGNMINLVDSSDANDPRDFGDSNDPNNPNSSGRVTARLERQLIVTLRQRMMANRHEDISLMHSVNYKSNLR